MSRSGLPTAGIAALQAGFDMLADAMLAVDEAGAIVLANAPAERMFGYAAGALRGLELETLVPAPLRAAHRRHRAGYLASPAPRVIETARELLGARHDGTPFPIGVSLSPVATERGVLVLCSVRDISHTWRARQVGERTRRDDYLLQIGRLALETHDYERAIERIPELVATALDVPMVAIFSTDWHREGLRVRAVTGLSAQAVDGLATAFLGVRFIRSVFVAGGPDAVTIDTLADDRYAAIRAHLAATGCEDFAMVPLFGREEPLGALVALAPTAAHFDRDKVSFLQSVANLLAAAVQRSRSEEQLAHAQRLDAIGQLTGGVAHDFNNLLTVISGNLQLLEAELQNDAAARDTIASALRAVDRGGDLTRRLLTFARRQSLQPRAVVPKPLLEELAHMLRRTLGEGIAVEVACDAGVPDVYADPNELDTALVNLALNARDAMPRGGRLGIAAREIALEAGAGNAWKLPAGRYVAFEVSDTGTGMAPDVQAHALEPFFTTKLAGKGSGLGLSMAYGFASQSGGTVAIDSRLGYGTHVTLLLPVAAARADVPEPAVAPVELPAVPGATILVVEDEADVRTIATRFLHAIGYRVLGAADAAQAMACLAAHPEVDLLFSDVVLGSGTNGIELARAARRTRPMLPVLLTSGYEHAAAEDTPGELAGEFELLHKPYRREQLIAAVREALAPE